MTKKCWEELRNRIRKENIRMEGGQKRIYGGKRLEQKSRK